MNRPMNRRRFLELSASVTTAAGPGDTLENFSPQVSEIAFATTATRSICPTQPIDNEADVFLDGTCTMVAWSITNLLVER